MLDRKWNDAPKLIAMCTIFAVSSCLLRLIISWIVNYLDLLLILPVRFCCAEISLLNVRVRWNLQHNVFTHNIWNNTHRRSNDNCSKRMKILTSQPHAWHVVCHAYWYSAFHSDCGAVFVVVFCELCSLLLLFVLLARSFVLLFICVHTYRLFQCVYDIKIHLLSMEE